MRTAKDSPAKNSRQKTQVAAASKAKKVKTVEIELRARKAAVAIKPLKASEKVVKNNSRLVSQIAKTVVSNKGKLAATKAKVSAKASEEKTNKAPSLFIENPEYLAAPPEKLLKPFRKMAELNRQQAKRAGKGRGKKGNFLAKQLKKGKRYLIDLRVHTPGTVGYFASGGIEPGPALARLANVKGLNIIGLTDYYDASYVDAVRATSEHNPELTILPGLCLRCQIGLCREAFLLVLFPESTPAAHIYKVLDELEVPKSAYGNREHCLSMDFGRVLETIERNGAVAIPSRVDKTPYRQLAIAELVDTYGFRTFDLAHPDSPDIFRDRWPEGGFTFFSFSNANALGQIGNRIGKVYLSQPGFAGIKELVQRCKL